ncbi:MAG: DMT family transporter [Planctomycetales bacterium]|nr:DMT family transporter [Planctomycetales bacterium]MCA9162355.1 DMT family transporter [Planctomycetales bacterium]
MPDAPNEFGDETQQRQRIVRGRLCVLAAAIMWSTSGFFAQSPVFSDWPESERGLLLAFWRATFASSVLIPMTRRRSWSPLMPVMVVIFVLMNITFLTALVRTTSANAIWLQNTAPMWVFFVGVFGLGEVARRADYWLIGCCAAGVGFILWYEMGGKSPVGVICGLLSGATYAAVVLCLRQLRGHDAAWLAVVNHVGTALAISPLLLTTGVWPQGMQWVYLAAFGIFQMGLPYVLFALGLRSLSGHEASGIVLLEPLLVPLWVWIAYRQLPAWWTVVGGAFILTGLLIRYVAVGAGSRAARVVAAEPTHVQ